MSEHGDSVHGDSVHGDMGCEKFAGVAAELALGVLTGRERAEALAHMEHCDACRERVRQLTMTGEQLLELLPAVEPPAGFETRVLSRLGIASPDVPPTALDVPPPAAEGLVTSESLVTSEGLASSRRRRTRRAAKTSPPGHSGPAARPGSTRGPGRRTLATLATALVVLVAAVGGWGLRSVTSSATPTPLSSAPLMSATAQDVGAVYFYNSGTQWLYMAVDMPSGNGVVTCELKASDGHYTTVGTFRLSQGYGAWGSPARWSSGRPAGARLVGPDGTVLATATFS